VGRSIPFSARVTVPEVVLFRECAGEAVILNLQTESYLGLDAVGARMWTLVTAGPTIAAAFVALLAEYDVAPDILREDLQRLLGEMLEHGLIELNDA
jgi:hypothetical protein